MTTPSLSLRPLATSTARPLSCISSLNHGTDCGTDNWDLDPSSGFYTVCCDGDIIDITGFNSYANYTLLLKNLVCCEGQNPGEEGEGYDERSGCLNATATAMATDKEEKGGKPLSQLLATSTDVAVPWTETRGSRKTSRVAPECFWSQNGVSTGLTSASASPVRIGTGVLSSVGAATSSAVILSSTGSESGRSSGVSVVPSATVNISSRTGSASGNSATGTSLATVVILPGWLAVGVVVAVLGLSR